MTQAEIPSFTKAFRRGLEAGLGRALTDAEARVFDEHEGRFDSRLAGWREFLSAILNQIGSLDSAAVLSGTRELLATDVEVMSRELSTELPEVHWATHKARGHLVVESLIYAIERSPRIWSMNAILSSWEQLMRDNECGLAAKLIAAARIQIEPTPRARDITVVMGDQRRVWLSHTNFAMHQAHLLRQEALNTLKAAQEPATIGL